MNDQQALNILDTTQNLIRQLIHAQYGPGNPAHARLNDQLQITCSLLNNAWILLNEGEAETTKVLTPEETVRLHNKMQALTSRLAITNSHPPSPISQLTLLPNPIQIIINVNGGYDPMDAHNIPANVQVIVRDFEIENYDDEELSTDPWTQEPAHFTRLQNNPEHPTLPYKQIPQPGSAQDPG